ncbi:hypothetical protein ONZ45_g11173 [Pleurotus djamor]|nr:hypothetical protein ONZ45_g11173 [Pleurotus djamor]
MGLLWSHMPFALGFFVSIFVLNSFTRKENLPPGPPRLPVLGNLLQLTETESIWRRMTVWGQKYGPIVSLSVLGKPIIVLNSHKAASDLLDRRYSIYSNRPKNIVVGELLTKGYLMAITRYGDLWKRMRRAAHEAVGPHIYEEYFPQLELEASVLISTFLESPDNFFHHIRRTTTSLMISLIYGLPPILDSNDPMIIWIEGAAQRLAIAARPGAHYVEFLTWMTYLPRWICPWRTDAERWHIETSAKFRELLDGVAAREKAGSHHPCISTRLLQECSKGTLSLEETTWAAGTLYLAGSDTTAITMLWFMQAMLLHPSVQFAAQEELDRVVGKSRMPTFGDFDNLSYIQAIVKEVLRWRPVPPLGLPHSLDREDTYHGYQIPKDSIVIANAWGLNQDPAVYGNDAHEFNPERYLNSTGKVVTPATIATKDEGHVTYGFGRRLCVGRYVANSNLFIQAASVLWAFQILPERDEKGDALLPDVNAEDVDGLLLAPPKFRCRLVPRGGEVLAIVQSTREERMSGSKRDVPPNL